MAVFAILVIAFMTQTVIFPTLFNADSVSSAWDCHEPDVLTRVPPRRAGGERRPQIATEPDELLSSPPPLPSAPDRAPEAAQETRSDAADHYASTGHCSAWRPLNGSRARFSSDRGATRRSGSSRDPAGTDLT